MSESWISGLDCFLLFLWDYRYCNILNRRNPLWHMCNVALVEREVSLWRVNPWHSCYEWVLDYRSGLLPALTFGFGGELVGVATYWTCEISYELCATLHRVREIAMLHPVRGNLAWDQWIHRAHAWANLGIQALPPALGSVGTFWIRQIL